jgi:hypothetical protein
VGIQPTKIDLEKKDPARWFGNVADCSPILDNYIGEHGWNEIFARNNIIVSVEKFFVPIFEHDEVKQCSYL